jgi:hypothetical protein
MLEYLHLENVGPAPQMAMELAPRLNLITGDNGLGKSFLLDVSWWALTRKWPHDVNGELTSGYAARPTDRAKPATIDFRLTSKSGHVGYTSHYSPRDEAWTGKAGRPWNPGLVLYAHSDGGFSIWDPARNYWKKKGNVDVQERIPAYVFSPKEVWDGLEAHIEGKTTVVCNGLVRDWAAWVREGGQSAANMASVLRDLSASEDERDLLEPGPLVRLSVNDARDIPSLRTGYAQTVPILHASAGVRRIVALAYMLLWSWQEHHVAAQLLGERPTSQVVMLIDEVESHLHPRWQRTILRSLLSLMGALHEKATIQLVTATHSPLILASAEPFFDASQDAWFDLDLVGNGGERTVQLTHRHFVRRGDVSSWLTSEAFDLRSGYSLPAEAAMAKARALLRMQDAAKLDDVEEVDEELRSVLGDIDPFWVRWSAFVERRREAR